MLNVGGDEMVAASFWCGEFGRKFNSSEVITTSGSLVFEVGAVSVRFDCDVSILDMPSRYVETSLDSLKSS